jgi:hypothetical protein
MRGDRKDRLGRALGGLALVLACLAPAFAEDTVVKLSVTVDPVKANGSPWDGYPAVGGRLVIPDSSNAPDFAVCVVYASGAPECVWQTVGARKVSHCPDSEKCTIPGIKLHGFPVGLIFLDTDLVRNDLIDFVVLTAGSADAGEVEKVEKNMQAAMANLTPGGTPREREHRRKKARVLPLDLCIGEKQTCDLSQSRFFLEKQ